MSALQVLGDVLEAADRLTLEEQEQLLDTLHKRLRERRRAELAKDIQGARTDYEEGHCRPVSPEELKREIMS